MLSIPRAHLSSFLVAPLHQFGGPFNALVANARSIPLGWEEGVTQMKVGEKAILDITR